MNRSALKTYAPKARLDFIRAVTDRAAFFGLTPKHTEAMQETGDVVLIGGRAFPKVVAQQRRSLEGRIRCQGFDQVMEAMAYIWFNRFVALRYMELHGYLDHGYRVLSSADTETRRRSDAETGRTSPLRVSASSPEILLHAEHVTLPGLDGQQVINLKLDGTREAELYRLLLVAQCNALHEAMPFLFEKIADETELLLPDNLLHSDSLIRQLVNEIEEADWQQVEIIGWLYQFYISDKKDEVMDRKQAVPKDDIPAVTQLFTPHWIVRYLVENSLGRLWLLNRPGSKLREHMPYYIEGEQDTDLLVIKSPEEIKFMDPAVGSGHILVYAFDVLCRIYEEVGYPVRDIPRLILENNLYGLDIDDRAAQLAAFALTMKALEKDPRYLRREKAVAPQVIAFRDVQWEEGELKSYIDALDLGELFNQPMLKLLHQFEEAKNFGSLIQPCLTEAEIQSARTAIHNSSFIIHNSEGQLFLRETHRKVLRVLEQAERKTMGSVLDNG